MTEFPATYIGFSPIFHDFLKKLFVLVSDCGRTDVICGRGYTICNTKVVQMGCFQPQIDTRIGPKSVSNRLFWVSLCRRALAIVPAFRHFSSGRRRAACRSVRLFMYGSNEPASLGEAGASTEIGTNKTARQASPHRE